MRAVDLLLNESDLRSAEGKWPRLIELSYLRALGRDLFGGEVVSTANSHHFSKREMIAVGVFTDDNIFHGKMMVFNERENTTDGTGKHEFWIFEAPPKDLLKNGSPLWTSSVTSIFFRSDDVSCKYLDFGLFFTLKNVQTCKYRLDFIDQTFPLLGIIISLFTVCGGPLGLHEDIYNDRNKPQFVSLDDFKFGLQISRLGEDEEVIQNFDIEQFDLPASIHSNESRFQRKTCIVNTYMDSQLVSKLQSTYGTKSEGILLSKGDNLSTFLAMSEIRKTVQSHETSLNRFFRNLQFGKVKNLQFQFLFNEGDIVCIFIYFFLFLTINYRLPTTERSLIWDQNLHSLPSTQEKIHAFLSYTRLERRQIMESLIWEVNIEILTQISFII
jgi:hypothetical protein